MKKLLDLKFIVTLTAMGCVQHALSLKGIDANTYSVLMSLAVGGFLAITWKDVPA
jgi:hypothetical protein